MRHQADASKRVGVPLPPPDLEKDGEGRATRPQHHPQTILRTFLKARAAGFPSLAFGCTISKARAPCPRRAPFSNKAREEGARLSLARVRYVDGKAWAGRSAVTKDIEAGGVYGGMPAGGVCGCGFGGGGGGGGGGDGGGGGGGGARSGFRV